VDLRPTREDLNDHRHLWDEPSRIEHPQGRGSGSRGIGQALGETGRLTDPKLDERLVAMVTGFVNFCGNLSDES